jgi:predicted transcriptional regulator/DNA-binding XRE family transcriptional regulator
LRRREGLTQAQLARRLGISASYLNLIENDRRPLTAPLLIRLAQQFDVDLQTFADDGEARLIAELLEVFGDALFDDANLSNVDVRELAGASPAAARAVITLYRQLQRTEENAKALAARVTEEDPSLRVGPARLPSEEVSDFLQNRNNHFPALEDLAEALWQEANLDEEALTQRLHAHLENRLKVRVENLLGRAASNTLRRFDPKKRVLYLSERLPQSSRNFQLAHQIGLLASRDIFDDLLHAEGLHSDQARMLGRVALANYFAGAVLMPYQRFLQAAQELRYDIEVLCRRFLTSYEQVCHRLTTLSRAGHEGVAFHLIRVDVAGNISKRFSGSGIRFARYSGACPRWNVFTAFLTPGMIRTQISTMPDGASFFCMARTLRSQTGGYGSPQASYAIGLGCKLEDAPQLIYADGVDLQGLESAVPVGVTCRLCERTDCPQRAFPALQTPLEVDENVRRLSFYAPDEPRPVKAVARNARGKGGK